MISYVTTPNATYSAIRVETSPEKKGEKSTTFRTSFDARKSDTAQKATDFANKKFADGKKVVIYLLELIDGKWVRTDIAEADGRPTKPKASSTNRKSEVAKATSDFAKTLELLEKAVQESNEKIASIEARIASIEAELAKKANKKGGKK